MCRTELEHSNNKANILIVQNYKTRIPKEMVFIKLMRIHITKDEESQNKYIKTVTLIKSYRTFFGSCPNHFQGEQQY